MNHSNNFSLKTVAFAVSLAFATPFVSAENLYCNQPECTTDWIKIKPDAAASNTIICQSLYPYIDNWTYRRDHWTVTCWWSLSGNWITNAGIGCQNWNTIWGDSHYYQINIYCKKQRSKPSGGGAVVA